MLHYFNPGHEAAVANGSLYYMMPYNQRQMQQNLSFLPAWYAPPEDYVYLPDACPSFPEEFRKFVTAFFPDLGKPLFSDHMAVADLKNHSLALWGISPQSIYFFRKMEEKHSTGLLIPEWHKEIKELTSRHKAKECLEFLCSSCREISGEIIPSFFTNLTSAEHYIKNSSHTLLAKSPFSSSGKGLVWIHKDHYHPSHYQVLKGILKKQKCFSLEKALKRKVDFAMQFFTAGPGQTEFNAFSLFRTKEDGKYDGNILTSQNNIRNHIHRFIKADLTERITALLIEFLNKHISPFYKGCVGIDMFVYEENGKYALHPCVEINLRYNMGYLAHRIYEKWVEPGREGMLKISFYKEKGEAYAQHEEMKNSCPLVFSSGKKVCSGYFTLCPVKEDSHYSAYVFIPEQPYE